MLLSGLVNGNINEYKLSQSYFLCRLCIPWLMNMCQTMLTRKHWSKGKIPKLFCLFYINFILFKKKQKIMPLKQHANLFSCGACMCTLELCMCKGLIYDVIKQLCWFYGSHADCVKQWVVQRKLKLNMVITPFLTELMKLSMPLLILLRERDLKAGMIRGISLVCCSIFLHFQF